PRARAGRYLPPRVRQTSQAQRADDGECENMVHHARHVCAAGDDVNWPQATHQKPARLDVVSLSSTEIAVSTPIDRCRPVVVNPAARRAARTYQDHPSLI